MAKAIVAGGVVFFSLVAAACWLRSATVSVKAPGGGYTMAISEHGTHIYSDGIDVTRTAVLQSWWNRAAAGGACLAAVCQGIQALTG